MTEPIAKADDAPLESESRLHRVVVFALPDDPHDLRDLLVEQLGLNPTDAQIHVHALPGLLPDRLSAHDAAELAAAIRSLGVNAMAMPNQDVPGLGRFQTLHHVRCRPEGLEIINLRGARESLVPWEDLLLMSIGMVPQIPPHHTEAPRMQFVTAGTHDQPHTTSLSPASGPEAILVASNPHRAFHIYHGQMNYEYLGDRLTASAANNFRCLVQDLLAAAPTAWLTPSTRAFVDRGLLRHYEFHSTDELRRYTQFHLLVRNAQTHGGDGVEGLSSSGDAATMPAERQIG